MPSDLTAELLLRKMEEEPSRTVSDILREHNSYRTQISRWKATVAGFDQKYRALMRARNPKNIGVQHQHGCRPTYESRDPEWKEKFMAKMMQLGPKASVHKACVLLRQEGLEITEGGVYSRLNPAGGAYDPVFAEQYNMAEGARIAKVEQVSWDRAMDGKSDLLAVRLLRDRLPYLYGNDKLTIEEKSERNVTLRVVHEFRERIANRSQEMFDDGDVVEMEGNYKMLAEG